MSGIDLREGLREFGAGRQKGIPSLPRKEVEHGQQQDMSFPPPNRKRLLRFSVGYSYLS